jgi:hypothetical protein
LKRVVKRGDGKVIASNGLAASDDAPMKASDYSSDRSDLPDRVDLRPWCTEVEDQSQSNSCAANAAAGAYEYLCKKQASLSPDDELDAEDVGDISRMFIYYVGRKNDQVRWGRGGTAVKDEGMTLSGGANAMTAKGACTEAMWPFDLGNVNARPSEECFDQAMKYKISEVKNVPTDTTAMKQCLADGYPIVFGCKLTQPFFRCPQGKVATPDPDDPQSASHGLHAMLIVGYSEKQQVFIVRNSWGTDWGDNGYCYMPYDYIGNSEFNMGGMYSIRGLTEYDFTPDGADDADDLYDPDGPDDDEQDLEVEEEDLGDDEDDPDGEDGSSMFDPLAEFKKVVGKFDTDGSGEIDKNELKNILRMVGIPAWTAGMLMGQFDSDGSGTISFEELQGAVGPLLGFM